ncbi:tripartite tricarboxylate transporter permease [Arthrobacter nitrophenolicus]|uniref:Tripartite tricarboxylate transporter permease n=1 Tax=Arthrobacter nitrophenolicus TaxID=683150 RepID=A0A4R5YAC3_9MICC|nr:tripartite tricarboxylate transporter permease [Arthrobacter nitrophenolicus]TDL40092.1 tripartite tricarboxylate transporter permease [Arthrobacter nitrophenolicus]
MFEPLLNGFLTVLTPTNLIFAFIGCVLGMLVGVLPGFGPAAATALLLPVTFTLGPVTAIIMLAAILYGSAYGGTITAVLINVPGETSSVATTIDGYQMARRGRAGPALAIAAIGSFIGGLIGVLGFVAAAPLSKLALAFGPAEFFALTLLGLTLVVGLGTGSIVKALISAAIGLLLGVVGLDPANGVARFTFGSRDLFDGLNFIPVIMGIFGLSELFASIGETMNSKRRPITVGQIMPSRGELKQSAAPILRGSILGFGTGLLPGSPGAIASFGSYVIEKRLSKQPWRFGKGAIEGVAGPESANNSNAIAGMIPMFILGIPTSATMAIMMGAFIVNGLVPGPLLFNDHPDVAWGIIASLVVGNVILLVLNLPLVRVWVAFLRTPFPVLYCFVIAFMIIGAYSIDGSVFNVFVMVAAGLLGLLLKKLDVPLTPIALTLVLGQMMERSLNTSLQISHGSPAIFTNSGIAMTLLILTAVVLLVSSTRSKLGPALAKFRVRKETLRVHQR